MDLPKRVGRRYDRLLLVTRILYCRVVLGLGAPCKLWAERRPSHSHLPIRAIEQRKPAPALRVFPKRVLPKPQSARFLFERSSLFKGVASKLLRNNNDYTATLQWVAFDLCRWWRSWFGLVGLSRDGMSQCGATIKQTRNEVICPFGPLFVLPISFGAFVWSWCKMLHNSYFKFSTETRSRPGNFVQVRDWEKFELSNFVTWY